MKMEFNFVYNKRGIISSCECNETQSYYASLEDAENIIKKDLAAVFRQMKNGNAYLRVSTGPDVWSQKQALCINQSYSDVDNGVYTVTIFDGLNSKEERKMSAALARKTVLEVYKQMILVEEHKAILEIA